MADLPASQTQLTWLEREEPPALRPPSATADTQLLSGRKDAKTLQHGGKALGPAGSKSVPKGLGCFGTHTLRDDTGNEVRLIFLGGCSLHSLSGQRAAGLLAGLTKQSRAGGLSKASDSS